MYGSFDRANIVKFWKKNSVVSFYRKKNFGESEYTKATSLLCEMSSTKVSIFLTIEL